MLSRLSATARQVRFGPAAQQFVQKVTSPQTALNSDAALNCFAPSFSTMAGPKEPSRGPGPFKLEMMSDSDDRIYWKKMHEEFGIAKDVGALGLFGAADGVLHRRNDMSFDAIGLTKDTHKKLSELILPGGNPDALVATIDGGGHAAIAGAWFNLFTKTPKLPIVVAIQGAFGEQWYKDLKNEFADKGITGNIVPVRSEIGRSPSVEDINESLKRHGYPADAPYNFMGTSHETGTGVVLLPEVMRHLATSPQVEIAILDITSGLLNQNIPGIGDTITCVGALQKGVRGPGSIGLAVVAPTHKKYLKMEAPTVALPKSLAWSEAAKNGQREIVTGMFDGSNIVRSTPMTDMLRLHYAIHNINSRAKDGQNPLASAIARAENSKKLSCQALETYQKTNDNPVLGFLVKDDKFRGAFNLVTAYSGTDLTRQQRVAARNEAHKILSENAILYDVRPYPSPETGNEMVDGQGMFRHSFAGTDTKEEADAVVEAMDSALKQGIQRTPGKQTHVTRLQQELNKCPEKGA